MFQAFFSLTLFKSLFSIHILGFGGILKQIGYLVTKYTFPASLKFVAVVPGIMENANTFPKTLTMGLIHHFPSFIGI